MQHTGRPHLNPPLPSIPADRHAAQNYTRLILAIVVFAVTTGLYLFLPQYFYVGDDIQAAMSIEHGVTGHYFFHPAGSQIYAPSIPNDPDRAIQINTRYYLEYPISVLVGRLWQALGWEGNVVTPILVLRALAGGLGVLFVYLAICETGCDPRLAALASLGFGVSAAYWTYSTRIYQTITMGTALALVLYLLIRYSKAGKRIGWGGKVALATVLWFATLSNITAIFSFLPIGLAIAFLHPDQKLAAKIKEFVLFSVVCGVLGIFIILFIVLNPAAPESANPFTWQDAPEAVGTAYGIDFLKDAFRAVLGFARSIVLLPGGPNSLASMQAYWDSIDGVGKALLVAFNGVVLAFTALPVVALLLQWRKLQNRWLWVTLIIWFVVYAGFNWYWEPGAVKYWITPVMCWWVAVALILNHFKNAPRYRTFFSVASAFVIAVFVINFAVQFLPEGQSDNDTSISISEAIGTASNPNDLFVSDRMDLDFYITYFADRNVISIDLINEATGSEDVAVNILKEQLELHRADNGQIYIYAKDSADLLSLAQFVGLENEGQLEPTWEFPSLTIYRAVYSTASN